MRKSIIILLNNNTRTKEMLSFPNWNESKLSKIGDHLLWRHTCGWISIIIVLFKNTLSSNLDRTLKSPKISYGSCGSCNQLRYFLKLSSWSLADLLVSMPRNSGDNVGSLLNKNAPGGWGNFSALLLYICKVVPTFNPWMSKGVSFTPPLPPQVFPT